MVLAAFLEQDAWGVSALARHLEINKTVIHRILTTLAASGLLAPEEGSTRYVLGPLSRQLGERATLAQDLPRVARPILEEIGRATRETVTLAVIRDFEGFCLDSVDSPQAMRMTYYRGECFPLNAGAMGKALLAFQSDAFVEAYLASASFPGITPRTIVDPDALRVEVGRIRRFGHADSEGEITPGARSVGVPVWRRRERLLCVLVLSAPAFRLQGKAAEAALTLLHAASARLSAALGYVTEQDERREASARRRRHAV